MAGWLCVPITAMQDEVCIANGLILCCKLRWDTGYFDCCKLSYALDGIFLFLSQLSALRFLLDLLPQKSQLRTSLFLPRTLHLTREFGLQNSDLTAGTYNATYQQVLDFRGLGRWMTGVANSFTFDRSCYYKLILAMLP